MIRAISNNIPFTSTYSLNMNQKLDPQADMQRDFTLVHMFKKAENAPDLYREAEKFFKEKYASNPQAPLMINIILPNKEDADFEYKMKALGVNFNKIA